MNDCNKDCKNENGKIQSISFVPPSGYEILRSCLWFAKGQKVSAQKMKEYFTDKAIGSLSSDEYIKAIYPKVNPLHLAT